jgi:hypothetical protein
MYAMTIHRDNDSPIRGTPDARDDRTDLKVGDRYQLACGHEGRVVWISHNGDTFAVRGVTRSCRTCGKRTSGAWSPTVYLLSGDERAEQRHTHRGQRHFRRVAGPNDGSEWQRFR